MDGVQEGLGEVEDFVFVVGLDEPDKIINMGFNQLREFMGEVLRGFSIVGLVCGLWDCVGVNGVVFQWVWWQSAGWCSCQIFVYVAASFGCCTKERWAFTPSHLKGGWNNQASWFTWV